MKLNWLTNFWDGWVPWGWKRELAILHFLFLPKFCCKGNRASCTLLSSIALMIIIKSLKVSSCIGDHPSKPAASKRFVAILHPWSKSCRIFWTKGIAGNFIELLGDGLSNEIFEIEIGIGKISCGIVALPFGSRRGSWAWLHVASIRGRGMLLLVSS